MKSIREWFLEHVGRQPCYGDVCEVAFDGSNNGIADMESHCRKHYPDLFDLPIEQEYDKEGAAVARITEHNYDETGDIILTSDLADTCIHILSDEPECFGNWTDGCNQYAGEMMGVIYYQLQSHGDGDVENEDSWGPEYLGDGTDFDNQAEALKAAVRRQLFFPLNNN